jgi:hypothetical protein
MDVELGVKKGKKKRKRKKRTKDEVVQTTRKAKNDDFQAKPTFGLATV